MSQVIIFIGTERQEDPYSFDILYDIDSMFFNVLNITYNDKNLHCGYGNYGNFVLVINKMISNITNEELSREIMTPEPDFIDGSDERNIIRRKINDCFSGNDIYGLPMLGSSDDVLDYDILDDRFKSGLAFIANGILQKASVPRHVDIEGLNLEVNSRTTEAIVTSILEKINEYSIP